LARADCSDTAVVDGLQEAHLDATALQPGAPEVLNDGMAGVGVDLDAWHEAALEPQRAGHAVIVDLVLRRVRGVVGLDAVGPCHSGAHVWIAPSGPRSNARACLARAYLRAAAQRNLRLSRQAHAMLWGARGLRATVLPSPID